MGNVSIHSKRRKRHPIPGVNDRTQVFSCYTAYAVE